MPVTYQHLVRDLIRARKSSRTHTGQPLTPDLRQKLETACACLETGLQGEPARFTLLEKPFDRDVKVRLGNYGLQKNPRYFFVGAVKKGDTANESYGYLMEQLVLKATDLGLGTCWIGFFDRRFFADFPTEADERFPAACTVGHPADRRLLEKISRAAVRAEHRKSADKLFFTDDWQTPLALDPAEPYGEALEMVRLAPSAGNSQPWRILRENGTDTFHFFIKKQKALYFRSGLNHIDLGIAMCHFQLAAAESGCTGHWRHLPSDPSRLPANIFYTMSWVGD